MFPATPAYGIESSFLQSCDGAVGLSCRAATRARISSGMDQLRRPSQPDSRLSPVPTEPNA